ncbi:MAG TPA: hypothetical protein VFS67_10450, partial [Polyangiaceae bacterium]|nr:hypothetical protein [Polyangiaceae bacterium]
RAPPTAARRQPPRAAVRLARRHPHRASPSASHRPPRVAVGLAPSTSRHHPPHATIRLARSPRRPSQDSRGSLTIGAGPGERPEVPDRDV